MVWPLLHWTTYEEGALPLGASHIRATVQSVTLVTRRFFGAAADCWASAALELPRETTPNRRATMPIVSNARFRIVTLGLSSPIRTDPYPVNCDDYRETTRFRQVRRDCAQRPVRRT